MRSSPIGAGLQAADIAVSSRVESSQPSEGAGLNGQLIGNFARHQYFHLCTGVQRTGKIELCADSLGPLPHSRKSIVAGAATLHDRGVNAYSVIADRYA